MIEGNVLEYEASVVKKLTNLHRKCCQKHQQKDLHN